MNAKRRWKIMKSIPQPRNKSSVNYKKLNLKRQSSTLFNPNLHLKGIASLERNSKTSTKCSTIKTSVTTGKLKLNKKMSQFEAIKIHIHSLFP
jgi:hypothetical protein